jgi:hypothetical protein
MPMCIQARPTSQDDQIYLDEPQAVAAGLKRMAMVMREGGLVKSIAEDVSRQVDQHGLSIRTFRSVAEATVWAQTGLTEPRLTPR